MMEEIIIYEFGYRRTGTLVLGKIDPVALMTSDPDRKYHHLYEPFF